MSVRVVAAYILFVSTFTLAGCLVPASETPASPFDGAFGGSAGGSQSTDGSSGAGDGTVAGGSATSGDDPLATEFPGCQPTVNADVWREDVLRLLNVERTSRGLNPVTENSTLEAQADQYACEMIFYDFFAHDNPVTGTSLRDRAAEFGYSYWVIGENLAAGQPTPETVVRDWMESPGHRANMLDERFTEAGVGIRSGGEFGIYWVLEFGRPASMPYVP
jgi:uncharacterized protein YkwD